MLNNFLTTHFAYFTKNYSVLKYQSWCNMLLIRQSYNNVNVVCVNVLCYSNGTLRRHRSALKQYFKKDHTYLPKKEIKKNSVL